MVHGMRAQVDKSNCKANSAIVKEVNSRLLSVRDRLPWKVWCDKFVSNFYVVSNFMEGVHATRHEDQQLFVSNFSFSRWVTDCAKRGNVQ